MAYATLDEFVRRLERMGELKRIFYPADPYLEITEITDRVVKAGGPALLFERPKGYDIPLLTNAFGSRKRMSAALGVADIDEAAARLEGLIGRMMRMPRTFGEKMSLGGALLNTATTAPPRRVKDGPCKEVIERDAPSLDLLPIQTCWPEDGGPFITLPLVITRHPVSGKRNVGMYRMQKYDSRATGMHWQLHKVGAEHSRAAREPFPVAVCLGGDPVLTYAATAPLPPDIDELLFAGWLRQKPVELVKCETSDLEVPACCDVVLEGTIDPNERRTEGPFGDHTGFYSLEEPFPVFHLTCLTRRKNPIYPSTVVGRPPMEDAWLGKTTERLFLPLLRLVVPEIVDMNLPPEACFHNLVIVSIRKRYPGHAYKVMNALWGLGQIMFLKCIIVVDEGVNVHDPAEVLWRASTSIDPQRDILFTRGPLDHLDHAGAQQFFGSKMGVDATTKWASEGYAREWPPDIVMDGEVKKRVDAIWSQLGLDS
jgi:4-hydroxy-3-polyprenylbenzoate decarboxylase